MAIRHAAAFAALVCLLGLAPTASFAIKGEAKDTKRRDEIELRISTAFAADCKAKGGTVVTNAAGKATCVIPVKAHSSTAGH